MKKRIFGLAAATAFAIAAIAAPAAAFNPINDVDNHSPHGDCSFGPEIIESFTGVEGMLQAHVENEQDAAWSAAFHSAQIGFCDGIDEVPA